MSLIYKRLGSQGEIHLSVDDQFTLCNIRCTHPNWYTIAEKPDKNPQMCTDCLEKKPSDGSSGEEKKERPARAEAKTEATE